jgi:hypothetical protein
MPKFLFLRILAVVLGFASVAGTAWCLPGQAANPSLLPRSFGSFACSVAADDGDAHRLPNLEPLEKEAGVLENEVCNYASGANRIQVHLAKYRDPSSAYEIYTSQLTPGMHPSTVGELSGVEKNRLLMLLGDLVLQVNDQQNASTADLQQLAKLVRDRSDRAPLPPIRTFLPEGLADGTQRYALGEQGFLAALDALGRSEYRVLASEIGFASGAETMLAEYRRGQERAVVLLIEYPTPQLAEQQLRHLGTVLPEIKQGTVKFERKASLLSAVLGATSPAFADKLRKDVNYETEVTWHQPTHTITDPPWVVVLSRIFVATGLFLVIAIVLGVAFGGVRVLTKRFFPGKVFDRPQDIEVLQLGLGGKRIDPSDFYRD